MNFLSAWLKQTKVLDLTSDNNVEIPKAAKTLPRIRHCVNSYVSSPYVIEFWKSRFGSLLQSFGTVDGVVVACITCLGNSTRNIPTPHKPKDSKKEIARATVTCRPVRDRIFCVS